MKKAIKVQLQELYLRYNRPEYIKPDPLEMVYLYSRKADREIAGLIAAGLAYGRVAQINRNAGALLSKWAPGPHTFLEKAGPRDLARAVEGFQHRWTTADEMMGLLLGIQKALRAFGSLEAAFLSFDKEGADLLGTLTDWAAYLRGGDHKNSLLPDPGKGGACKRLHMYLRWMVRKDAVDPGCWKGVSPSRLLVPVDVHMLRMGRKLGLTERKTGDLKSAMDITAGFQAVEKDDPVKFDFCLTRLGIHPDLDSRLLEC